MCGSTFIVRTQAYAAGSSEKPSATCATTSETRNGKIARTAMQAKALRHVNSLSMPPPRKVIDSAGADRARLGGEGLRAPVGGGIDLDELLRRSLATGLDLHATMGRGTLPAGLVQEIRALSHPPVTWDVQLARWFDEHFPAVERRRSYARPSRRQSAVPHIPLPGYVRPEELVTRRTFGVVLDTSGSMSAELLGKALGAIASYAAARDVPAARVVFCDAAAYDAGYLAVDEIAGRVKVRGRGGTELQPGIALLERAADFPARWPGTHHQRRRMRRAAGTPRACVPAPGGRIVAVHREGAGVPGELRRSSPRAAPHRCRCRIRTTDAATGPRMAR